MVDLRWFHGHTWNESGNLIRAVAYIPAVAAIVASSWAYAAEDAPGRALEAIAPADTLLYAELTRPAEFWAALQKTQLRQAVRESLLSEFLLNFTGATADLLCSSLTGRNLGQAAEHYDFTVAAVFAPPPPGQLGENPDVVILLAAKSNAQELQRLLAERIRRTLTARFPDVEIAEGRIAGQAVTDIAFSPRRVWTLAFPNNLVAYGRRGAVEWLLTSRRHLVDDPKYFAARKYVQPPDAPRIFCYAEVTQAAGEGAIFYAPGTAMAGILTIDGPLVHDRLLLMGGVELPRLAQPATPGIGSAFPAGPWQAIQVSFASGSEMLKWFGNSKFPAGRQADAAFTGLAWLALTGDNDIFGTVLAAEVADNAAAERRLTELDFEKKGPVWHGGEYIAIVSGGRLYLGRRGVMTRLVHKLTTRPAGPTLADTPGVDARLRQLPPESHGYSMMNGDFLMTAGGEETFKRFERVLLALPPFAASAQVIDNAIEVKSISPAGYGIWLTAANISAALEEP